MKFSEAIVEVAKIYHPGTIEFYAKRTPDPWAAMLDKIERAIKSSDPELLESIGEFYFSEAKRLIRAYQGTNPGPRPLSAGDGFMIGFDAPRASALMSIQTDSCYHCESVEDLDLETLPDQESVVRLVCQSCKARRELARQKRNSRLPDQKKFVRTKAVSHSQPNRRR